MMLKVQKWMDRISTIISALMCAAMMIILFVNVVLRLIPNIGGFRWYMEGSQYLNVWSMLIVCIAITCKGEHLRVNIMEDLCKKNDKLHIIQKTLVNFLIMLFYALVTWSGYVLSTKARQKVSTMPQFTMGQVYRMIPIACAICTVSAAVDLIVDLQTTLRKE